MAAAAERLSATRADEVIDVFVDAFRDYPVMRHVVGATSGDYERRLRKLIGFFVMNRVWRGEPLVGLVEHAELVAAATMTPPGERALPPEAAAYRTDLWNDLGEGARRRYEAFGAVWRRFAVAEPHHHLNMIGVRRSRMGRGFARVLLEHVHAMSEADAGSAGVSLSTEHADNVPLYRHFGYVVIGHAAIAEGVESWSFFRARSSAR